MEDKEKILDLLENLAAAEYYHEFFEEKATKDFLFIRPSGNPLSAIGFEKMTLCGDVVDNYTELIDIQLLEFFSDVCAMCVFTFKENFEYKGKQNDDIALNTSILKKINDEWIFSFIHRSSGELDLSLWSRYSSFFVT